MEVTGREVVQLKNRNNFCFKKLWSRFGAALVKEGE